MYMYIYIYICVCVCVCVYFIDCKINYKNTYTKLSFFWLAGLEQKREYSLVPYDSCKGGKIEQNILVKNRTGGFIVNVSNRTTNCTHSKG